MGDLERKGWKLTQETTPARPVHILFRQRKTWWHFEKREMSPQWVKKHQINQLNNTSPFVTRGKLSSIIWITRMSKTLQLENQQPDWHHHRSMLGFYMPFAEVSYVLSFIKFLSFPPKILWINISWTLLMGVVLSQNMQLPVIITLNISQEF